jgi:hypothetical protein
MNNYEKRKLLLDAFAIIASNKQIDFSDQSQVYEAMNNAAFIVDKIEEYVGKDGLGR